MKKLFYILLIVAIGLCQSSAVNAQGVGINPLGSNPDPSAMLDVSGASKGVLINRMTTAERDAIVSPANSLLIYNTTTRCLEIYANGLWQSVFCTVCPLPSAVTASASPNPICEGNTLTLTGSATGATTWSWTGPNSFTSTLQNPTISNITAAVAGVYTLTASNTCGSAAPVNTATVTVNTVPSAPTAGSHTPSKTQIAWNWNTVSGATGYKWGTTNDYNSATDMLTATSKTETGLICETAYTRFVWAYNGCGNSSYNILTQSTSSCFSCGSTLTDSRDGKTYNTILIGTQCWMSQNLNYGTFVTIHTGGQSLGTKFCMNNDSNCPYGGLYDWTNKMNGAASCNGTGSAQVRCTTPVQGICPSGWHVPSHYEWTLLERTICTSGTCATDFPYDMTASGWRGTDEGGKMKALSTWLPPNTGATNSSGFTALAGGNCSGGGGFSWEGTYGSWGSSTENDATWAWGRDLNKDQAKIYRGSDYPKSGGESIRCIKD